MGNSSPANPVAPATPDGSESASPVRLLWIGNPGVALEFAAERPSELHVMACDCANLGEYLEAAAAGTAPTVDAAVVDTLEDGLDVSFAVETLDSAAPDLPVVLLVPERSPSSRPAVSETSFCDGVVKTPGFMHQLLLTLAQARARLDVMTVFRATSEREARLRAILDLQPAVAVLVDSAGLMAAVNRAGLQLFGHTDGSGVVGRPFLDFVPVEERAAVRALFSAETEHALLDHSLRRPDGSRLQIRTRVTPFAHRDGAASLVTLDDRSSLHALGGHAQISGLGVVDDPADPDDEGWEDVLGEGGDEHPGAPALDPPDTDAAVTAESHEAQLAAELAALRETHDALRHGAEADRTALAEQVERAQAQQLFLDTERQRLESALAEAELQRDQADQRVASLDGERQALASELHEARASLVALTEHARRWEAALTESEAGAAAVAGAREALEQERNQLAGALEEALDENRRHAEAHARQVADVQASSEVVHRLRAQLGEARAALEAADVERASLGEVKAERDVQALRMHQALEDLQGLAADADRYERALGAARVDRRIKESALATSHGERERLTTALEHSEQTQQQLAGELAQRVGTQAVLDLQIADLDRERSELAADRDRLATLLQAANVDLERLAAEVRQSKQASDKARHERDALVASRETLAADREQLETALFEARTTNQRLAAEHEHDRVAVDQAQRAVAEMSTERTRLLSERDRLSRALQAVLANGDDEGDTPMSVPLQVERPVTPAAPGTLVAPTNDSPSPPVELRQTEGQVAPTGLPAPEPPVSGDPRERRRHQRIDGTFDGERLGLMDTPIQVQNLSISGCFVTSFYPPPSDPRFELRIDLGKHGVVDIEVQTAYVSPEIGYGVSFVQVSESARRSILAAVEAGKPASQQRKRSDTATPAA